MLRFNGVRRLRRVLPLRFFVAVTQLLLSRSAQAEAPAPVLLVVHGDELSLEKLRAAVARELHREVASANASPPANGGIVTVTYRRSAGELAVTWDGPKLGTVSRVIPARKESRPT